MREKIAKFIKIFGIELEDLQEDLKLLEKDFLDRESRNELTHYVAAENLVVLKQEMSGIRKFAASLHAEDYMDCENVDEAVRKIEFQLKDQIESLDITPAVQSIVTRRLQKVWKYINTV